MDPLIEATKMKFHNEPKELIDEYLLKSKIDFKQKNHQIQEEIKKQVQDLEAKLSNTNQSESDQAYLRQQIAMLHLKSGNIEAYEDAFKKIGQKSITEDLLFQLSTQAMRIAIFNDDEIMYKTNLDVAQSYKTLSFDSQSQLQVYQALYKLLFTKMLQYNELKSITALLTGVLQTFNAEELMPFEEFVIAAFVFAFSFYGRRELEALIERQMDNFQIVKANKMCTIIYSIIVDCNYPAYNEGLKILEAYLNNSLFLHRFGFTILNLFKLKVYDQYLLTYNAVKLEQLRKDLDITDDTLLDELEYFIFKGQLQAKIDGDILVKMYEDKSSQLFLQFVKNAEALIDKMEIVQKQK